jgi:hypothetical protein
MTRFVQGLDQEGGGTTAIDHLQVRPEYCSALLPLSCLASLAAGMQRLQLGRDPSPNRRRRRRRYHRTLLRTA